MEDPTPQSENEQPQKPEEAGFSLGNQEVFMVPLKDIANNHHNTFKNPYRIKTFQPATNSNDAELLESIRAQGVIVPVGVQSISKTGESPRYQLVYGYRRTSAAQMAGYKYLPAIILPENLASLYLLIVENSGHRALSVYEKAMELEAFRQRNPELTDDCIAKKLGIAPATVSWYKTAINESTPVLRMLMHSQSMGLQTGIILQPVFAQLSETGQIALARILVKGVTEFQAWELRNLAEKQALTLNAAKWVVFCDVLGMQSDIEVVENDEQGDKPGSANPDPASDVEHLPTEEQGVNAPSTGEETSTSLPEEEGLSEKINYLREQTGISPKDAALVLEQDLLIRAKVEVIEIACIGVRNGYSSQTALSSANRIMTMRGNKITTGLIREYQRLYVKLQVELKRAPEKYQPFIRQVFGLNEEDSVELDAE